MGELRDKIFQSVVTAAILGILGAAVSTYIEVRMLRHDVNEIRHDLDTLYGMTNDEVVKLSKPKREQ